MPARDMRTFLLELEEAGELVRVRREVDPRFEVAAVVHRLQREVNKAVLFEHVKGSTLGVVSNVFGSFERIARLLGVPKAGLAMTWARAEDGLASWPEGGGATVDLPTREVPLADLPVLTHCEKDGGPYITAGVALAKDPVTGCGNLSYHRVQVAHPPDLGFRSAGQPSRRPSRRGRGARRGAPARAADRRASDGDAGGRGAPSTGI